MTKGISGLNRCLWLALATSLPLFGVSFFRLNLGLYHIPIPAIMIGFILATTLFSGSDLILGLKKPSRDRTLFIFSMLILITHGISMFYGKHWEYSLREFIKISSAITTFWLFLLFFPEDSVFFDLSMGLTIGASCLLLLALTYQYSYVFKAPYLGTLFTEDYIYGKNHLAWLVTLLTPYCFVALFKKQFSFFWLAANTIMSTSVIYSMSRSSWVTITLIFFYIMFFALKDRFRINIKMLFLFIVGVTLFMSGIIVKVNMGDDLKIRLQSLINPNSLPETPQTVRLGKYSKINRWNLVKYSFNRFKESPLMGQGLAASEHGDSDVKIAMEMITHNDYIAILLETGLMGAIPFFIFLIFFAKQLMQTGKDPYKPFLLRAAQGSFLAILFLSNFIDIYTSVHYWLFLALALKAKQISQSSATEKLPEALVS